jgi:hypothetical protein
MFPRRVLKRYIHGLSEIQESLQASESGNSPKTNVPSIIWLVGWLEFRSRSWLVYSFNMSMDHCELVSNIKCAGVFRRLLFVSVTKLV